MYYVYILKSQKDGTFYTGVTKDLSQRFKEHNQHCSDYSSSKAPFDIAWFSVFKDKQLAFSFEKYLKNSSGFAFRNKRLI